MVASLVMSNLKIWRQIKVDMAVHLRIVYFFLIENTSRYICEASDEFDKKENQRGEIGHITKVKFST